VKETVRQSIHEFASDEDGGAFRIDAVRRGYPSIEDQAQRSQCPGRDSNPHAPEGSRV
jgi:hypothetical protein